MEKLIYLLWPKPGQTGADFSAQLTALAQYFAANGAERVQLNIVDGDVEAGAHRRQINQFEPWVANINFWLDSSQTRMPLQTQLENICGRIAGYLVTESEPLRNTAHRAPAGQRTPGFSQLVMLRKPERLSREEWLNIWWGSHTQIAIDTQSTFRYVQNLVALPLTLDAPLVDAIVEECFPIEALNSDEAFYDSVGNKEQFKQRVDTMIKSCMRFIEFDKLQVILTSEYRF